MLLLAMLKAPCYVLVGDLLHKPEYIQLKVQLMVSVRQPKASRHVSLAAPCRA